MVHLGAARTSPGMLVCVIQLGLLVRSALSLGIRLDSAVLARQSSSSADRGGLRTSEHHSYSTANKVKFLRDTLDQLKDFAAKSRKGIQERHKAEELRLQASIGQTSSQHTADALVQSIQSNQLALADTGNVYRNMLSFADSMANVLGSVTTDASCDTVSCGPNAGCTQTPNGTECVCYEGYIGTGSDCRAPAAYRPQRLLFEGTGGRRTEAMDLHVCSFSHNEVAIVFRDLNKGEIGRITLVSISEGGEATLVPPEQFTLPHEKAFQPVVAGSEGRRLLVSWRSSNRQGVGYVRGVALNTTGIRGAIYHMAWSEPLALAHDVSQKMAMVQLPGDRFAVMYLEKVLATAHSPVEHFGNAALISVDGIGSVSLLGRYHFTDSPICRLEVTRISPSVFIIAGRMAQEVDDVHDDAANSTREAVAIHGKLDDNELVFSAEPLNLEPNGTQVWARSVALIAANTFAYTYQTGSPTLSMKTAIVQVDPRTEAMRLLDTTTLLEGFSPKVSMLDVPYSAREPHTLAVYKDYASRTSKVNLCSWNGDVRKLTQCESFEWLSESVHDFAGVHLPGGRAFVAFTPDSKVPHFTVFGVARRPLYDIW
mmetsp:Transcript_10368/g.18571  ORF Transcript_10368/g.18571 Transcript_10368/m.18571 type:complete len:597 (-) Transcript_10368:37-1827(-)